MTKSFVFKGGGAKVTHSVLRISGKSKSSSDKAVAIARQTEVRQKKTCPLFFFFRTIESINAFGWLVFKTFVYQVSLWSVSDKIRLVFFPLSYFNLFHLTANKSSIQAAAAAVVIENNNQKLTIALGVWWVGKQGSLDCSRLEKESKKQRVCQFVTSNRFAT